MSVRSNVIYKYTCRSCDSFYIGSTRRHWFARVCEHRAISARTGFPTSKPAFSAIYQHAMDTAHPVLASDFKIIFNSNSFDLLTNESIAIGQLSPDLNTQSIATPLLVTPCHAPPQPIHLALIAPPTYLIYQFWPKTRQPFVLLPFQEQDPEDGVPLPETSATF